MPSPFAPTARAKMTYSATWLASTNPNVQNPRRITVRTASWRGSQYNRTRPRPARAKLGASKSAWSATPTVVPRPSKTSWCPSASAP